MNLEITCKGIADTSIRGGEIDITLEYINTDFIEQIPVKEIVMYADNKAILDAMDYDDIVDYIVSNYSVRVVDISGGV